jgi:hypothetical protein
MLQPRFRFVALAGGAALVLSLLSVTPARATTLPPSCVDLNNNGVCDAGEPALAPLLNAGSFDTSVAQPGYTPPGTPVGIVLNNLPLTADGLSLNATGNIVVNGKLKNPDATDVTMQSTESITLAQSAQIQYGRTHDGADGITLFAGTINFGPKSQIKVGGDSNFWDIEAETIHFGVSTKFQAAGDDTEIDITSIAGLTFDGTAQFKTTKTGTVSMLTQSSIAANGLKVTSGTIDIEADSPDGLPFPTIRTVALANCNINQDSVDGSLTISAGSPGFHSAVDNLTLQHCRVRSEAGSPDLEPTPIILP